MNCNEAEIAAGEWLARLDRDDSSPEELAAFERWKTADPRHAAAYARLAATWQALDRIQATRPSASEPIDNDYLNGTLTRGPSESSLGHLFQSSLDDSTGHPSSGSSHSSLPLFARQSRVRESAQYAVAENSPQSATLQFSNALSGRRSSHRPWLFVSVAASLLVAITGFWIAQTSGGPKSYRTGIGGFQRIVLEDQSVVELNTNSEVRVALMPTLRKVELVRGEASFEVVHDASRPFIVSAGDTAVRAVGTKFDVRRLDNSVEVTVDEGQVAVGAPSLLESKVDLVTMSIPQLTAGQSAVASGSGVRLRDLPKREMARKLAWQTQMIVFDGDTLAEVVDQFNRYNERQLVIADPTLSTIHIGGYFRPTNLDAFVSVLQSDFGIRINPDGNRLLLVTATAN
jgi:transmembrane sensor